MRPETMLGKTIKSFHAAIESEIATSFAEFPVARPSADASVFSGSFSVGIQRTAKRTVDVLFSVLMLLISSPLFAILSVVIRLSSKGPVFFRQERVGLRGKPFTILKFRTMRPHDSDTEHKQVVQSLLKDAGTVEGGEALNRYAEYLESRITRVGRFLRGTSLDELPQLWNILQGDMSLVGPRPHPGYEVEAYKPWYRRRLQVKPGLTGWSKLNLRFTPENYEEAILYDLWYVDNWSVALDLRILLLTVPFVLSMKDAS
jgi:lipopolysaccharide/colanic/teichoic acid biosynthesis glycosyltransferase